MFLCDLTDASAASDTFEMIRVIEQEDFELAHKFNARLKEIVHAELLKNGGINHYDLYWKCQLFDAPFDFDSYMLYIEKNRRPEKRFYQPRRKYLKRYVQAYQDLADGKLKLLTVSMPKRTGKALTLDTKLATPNGFITMGEVKVGDILLGVDGNPTKVTGVFPQGVTDVFKVIFECGEVVRASSDHLWISASTKQWNGGVILTTKQMNEFMSKYPDIGMYIPAFKFSEKYKSRSNNPCHKIKEIVEDTPEETQCITVDSPDHLFLVTESYIPTHNSQTGINFVSWISGRNPDGSTLMEGLGDALVTSFYNGCLEYLQDKDQYLYYDIFPNITLAGTHADVKTINLNSLSRFPTIMCRSIDSSQVGLSEANNLLYMDDCVDGVEEAHSRTRLESKWEKISGDIMGRAIEGTPIVYAGTRYSIYDPIGKMQEYASKNKWNWTAIEIPALDLETDESNFEFEIGGRRIFTTQFFREQRNLLSPEQFESEFQQQPFESKGILFPEKELKRYFELPVDVMPDAVFAVCDPAEKGSDSTTLLIAKVYGEDVFIVDCVFDSSSPIHTQPQCAKMLYDYDVPMAVFESNAAGTYYARDVEKLVKELGGVISITPKHQQANKVMRIETTSANIIHHFYFKDPSLYSFNSQYGAMIRELTSYVRMEGKDKQHDDAPDAMALLETELRIFRHRKPKIFQRPI